MTKLDLLLLTLNGAANRILCTIYLAAVHSFFWQNPKASTFVVMVLGSQTFQSGWNCLAQAQTLQAQGQARRALRKQKQYIITRMSSIGFLQNGSFLSFLSIYRKISKYIFLVNRIEHKIFSQLRRAQRKQKQCIITRMRSIGFLYNRSFLSLHSQANFFFIFAYKQ